MSLFVLIIIFTGIGGVLSVIAASFFLLMSEPRRKRILPHGISFATGALLSVSFLGLIPRAFESVEKTQMHALSATILTGLLSFFVLEKLLIWRHCHSGHCEAHVHEHDDPSQHTVGTMIILGDSIHNFVDGILIAAAFLTDIQLGIVTSLAVAAHEIPQELGDFAILLQSGYGKTKALLYNVLASFTTVIGGVLAYYCLEDLHHVLPYFLALAASSFIYIAVADLIPTLHKKTDLKASFQQIILIASGVLLIFSLHGLAHNDADEHAESETPDVHNSVH